MSFSSNSLVFPFCFQVFSRGIWIQFRFRKFHKKGSKLSTTHCWILTIWRKQEASWRLRQTQRINAVFSKRAVEFQLIDFGKFHKKGSKLSTTHCWKSWPSDASKAKAKQSKAGEKWAANQSAPCQQDSSPRQLYTSDVWHWALNPKTTFGFTQASQGNKLRE